MSSIKPISSVDKLPQFESVLTMRGQFMLGQEYKDDIVAIETGRKLASIVCTRNYMTSIEVFALRERMMSKGVTVNEIIPGDIGLIRAIYESVMASKKRTSVKEVGKHTRIFDDLIEQAIGFGASDIHIEIGVSKADINMRINGLVTKIFEWPRSLAIEVCRLTYTVMASNESKQTTFRLDEPQECVIDRTYNGNLVKMRYAATPKYPSGLKVVMRLLALNSYKSINHLEDLGYAPWQASVLMKSAMSSSGAIVTAGPTNSGKSTSMKYMIMAMDKLRNHESSIYTIEDPPEWVIPGATQVPARKIGSEGGGMAEFVRLVLRMDPDIIMIGEVRDKETGSVFQQTVESGHKVFSTLHTESALSIISRMDNPEIGVPRYTTCTPGFMSALVYQRLVPVTCTHCALDYQEGSKLYHSVASRALEYSDKNTLKFRNMEGCEHCRGGISGQTICAEVIEPNDDLLAFISKKDDIGARQYLHDLAGRKQDSFAGMDAMDHALSKMKQGIVCPSIVEHIFSRLDKHV